MQARSWRTLRFTTDLYEDHHPREGHIANMTGAGTVEGTTQYLSMRVLGYPEPPTTLTGSMRVNVKNVEITVIDIESWNVGMDFDTSTRRYFIKLWREPPFEMVEYRPPFNKIPEELLGNVAYSSKSPETLIIETPENRNCCLRIPSILDILSNSPDSVFGWNMRGGCKETFSLNYDPLSNSLNRIYAVEKCPNNRAFPYPAAELLDAESNVIFRIYDTPEEKRSALIIPQSFSLWADDMPKIEDSGEKYLVFLQAVDGVLHFDARPQSEEVFLRLSPVDTDFGLASDAPLLEINPNSGMIEVEGTVGKLAVGLDTITTDELSSIRMSFINQPNLRWAGEFIVNEMGELHQQPLLSSAGLTTSLIVNGEELVRNRWENESPEIRAAIIAGLIAILTSLLVAAWDDRRRMRQTEETRQIAKSDSPTVDNSVLQEPVQSQNMSTASAVLETKSDFMYVLLLLVSFVIIAIGWLRYGPTSDEHD